jgi:hypothetical protein
MILCIPHEQAKLTQLNYFLTNDSAIQDSQVFTQNLFEMRNAIKCPFPYQKVMNQEVQESISTTHETRVAQWWDDVIQAVHNECEKEHYSILVDCRSVEPTDTDTDFYVAYHPDYVQLTLIEQLETLCQQIGYSLTISTDYQPHPALNGIANAETLLVGINRQRYLSDNGEKSEHYGKMKRVLYTLMKEIHRYEIGQRADAKRKHLSQQERDDEGESLMFASFASKRKRNQHLFNLIDDSTVSDEFIILDIMQTYDFIIDEVVWVATHVCDEAPELINQRLETSLANFIHIYRTLDTRSPTKAPSPSGILKSELEHCLYWGRCQPSAPFITQSGDHPEEPHHH